MTEKSQQEIFVSEVLPSLFHGSPEEFIEYLARDGNKFLRFYWDQAGAALKRQAPSGPLGLNYDIRTPDKQTTIVLLTLPPPKNEPEAYFTALVYRPQRRLFLLGVSDTTKVLALELAQAQDGKPGTRLREWTRKLSGDALATGTPPHLEAFYDSVREQL